MKKDKKLLNIEFTSNFNKKRSALPLGIKIAFRETLEFFLENPNHNILHRHFLRKKYAGYESIDITSDYRAIFKESRTKTQITIKFYIIGTHKELYSK